MAVDRRRHGVGQVRRDPFAMLPFCGYHMGDYFRYWLSLGSRLAALPLIFGVNWFRTGEDGKFLWPGYGENMRALEWIVARARVSRSDAAESPLGTVPRYRDLTWKGLENFTPAQYRAVTSLDRELSKTELLSHDELFAKLGDKLPVELLTRRKELEGEIQKMPAQWTVPE
jgi:phosphoenolpyruvate carboxykinase (GTP)